VCDIPSLLLDINSILELNNLTNVVVCIFVVVLTNVWSIYLSIYLFMYSTYIGSELALSLM
jgi:hypothetical protein